MQDVRIIADSFYETSGTRLPCRIITLQLTYPYFIHAQVLRHRVFSSSVSSARAIPAKRFRQMVLENPAIPIYFGKNRPGMSAAEEVDDLPTALRIWDEAMRLALKKHEELEALGVHKEITNRLLLPFQHVTHLVTATAWDNWFDLRLNGAAIEHAQPDIVALARKIDVAMRQSTPQKLEYGEWHLPFVTPEDLEYDFACSAGFAHAAHQVPEVTLLSAARAARTSFLPETPKAISTELTFSRKLSVDKHWSPFEHVATPFDERFFHPSTQRNFSGWTQLRALIGG